MFKIMFKWVLDDSKAHLGEGKYAWTIKYPILTNIKKLQYYLIPILVPIFHKIMHIQLNLEYHKYLDMDLLTIIGFCNTIC